MAVYDFIVIPKRRMAEINDSAFTAILPVQRAYVRMKYNGDEVFYDLVIQSKVTKKKSSMEFSLSKIVNVTKL